MVHTLEPEIRQLHAEGALDEATAARAIALDRGEILSLFQELRVTLYAGVLLVTGGVGMILARNLDRIGPLAIVLAVALGAVACGLPAFRARAAKRPLTTAGDYLLLLGALLLSADLAYAEHAFDLLGPLWPWHLLLLAVVHASIAYAFGSSLVLAASLAALAGWLGVGGGFGGMPFNWPSSPELGGRALVCAAVMVAWRIADQRLRPESRFADVFDHFVANVAFWGALAWCLQVPWVAAGLPLLAVLAFLAIRHGLAAGREAFVVYGVLYAALGLCFAVEPHVSGVTPSLGFALLVVCVAAIALLKLHQLIRETRS